MSSYIKSFVLQSVSSIGANIISVSIDTDEVPIGSTIVVAPNTSFEETFIVVDIFSDGGLNFLTLSKPTEVAHHIGTDIWLTNYSEKYFKPAENNCPIVIENGQSSYRNVLLMPSNKTFTLNFSDENLFNNFNILDNGKHVVEKSFPSITIKPSIFGPKKFLFKSFEEFGVIFLHEDCESDICSSLQFELFSSNDQITYIHEAEKYLIDCGKSTFSQDIIDVQALSCDCDGQTSYLVTYCCDKSKDIDTAPCLISWTYDCSGNLDVSFPEVSCGDSNSIIDQWFYSEEDKKLKYNRFSNFCFDHCDPLQISDFLLIPPSLPTESQLTSCNQELNPTETTVDDPNYDFLSSFSSPYFELNSRLSDEVYFRNGIHLCFDKPYFFTGSLMKAQTEVLEKPNDSDLSYRSFYIPTKNGYFYESYSALICSESYPEINGNHPIIFEATEEEIANLTLPANKSADIHNLDTTEHDSLDKINSNKDLYNHFVSVVDLSKKPVESNIPIDDNLIKDVSLVDKFFTNKKINNTSRLENSDFISFTFCELNWKYWMKELPEKVYGKQNWYEDLNEEFFPQFNVLSDKNDLSNAFINFQSQNYKLFNNIKNGTYSSDNISMLHIERIPSAGFDTTLKTNDLVYNVPIFIGGRFLDFEVEYIFNPDPSKISELYSELTFPIKRREKIRYFLDDSGVDSADLPLYKSWSNHGVDMSFGVLNHKFYLKQGFGYRVTHSSELDSSFNYDDLIE